jgi:hypothetical protein
MSSLKAGYVTQHPLVDHPLETHYDSIVDEPQLTYQHTIW